MPPAGDVAGRKAWLKQRWHDRHSREADRYRDLLIEFYGEERGKSVNHAEAFELCEYGRKPTAAELRQLFPFFESKVQP